MIPCWRRTVFWMLLLALPLHGLASVHMAGVALGPQSAASLEGSAEPCHGGDSNVAAVDSAAGEAVPALDADGQDCPCSTCAACNLVAALPPVFAAPRPSAWMPAPEDGNSPGALASLAERLERPPRPSGYQG